MGNRAVKQPNGLYARFSEIVDDFTHTNHSREELLDVYRAECGDSEAQGKLKRADNSLRRFDEAIGIIELMHGKSVANKWRETLSNTDGVTYLGTTPTETSEV